MSTYTPEERMKFVSEALQSLLRSDQLRLAEVNKSMTAATGPRLGTVDKTAASAVEVAAENADDLVMRTARSHTYSVYLRSFERAKEKGETAENQFSRLYKFAVDELAKEAMSLTSRSTSWLINVSKDARLVALGEIVHAFQDAERA